MQTPQPASSNPGRNGTLARTAQPPLVDVAELPATSTSSALSGAASPPAAPDVNGGSAAGDRDRAGSRRDRRRHNHRRAGLHGRGRADQGGHDGLNSGVELSREDVDVLDVDHGDERIVQVVLEGVQVIVGRDVADVDVDEAAVDLPDARDRRSSQGAVVVACGTGARGAQQPDCGYTNCHESDDHQSGAFGRSCASNTSLTHDFPTSV
ncbi:MAG: hypothetical protein QOH83_1542 [Solirubrobacteraceae bacterium]|nr:hypothetical protein [Solirubrobacteraceae bacterium]